MHTVPTHIAKLFDDSLADGRRVNREIDTIRTRSDNTPRRRSPRVRNERH
jgi:hypothetical protein